MTKKNTKIATNNVALVSAMIEIQYGRAAVLATTFLRQATFGCKLHGTNHVNQS